MQEIVGSVHDIKFDIEVSLEDQYGAQSLPFPGMDSKCGRYYTLFKTYMGGHKMTYFDWTIKVI